MSQRDEALHRLSQSLEEAQDGREKLQIEYDQQAEQLAEQVALLESQLLDVSVVCLLIPMMRSVSRPMPR